MAIFMVQSFQDHAESAGHIREPGLGAAGIYSRRAPSLHTRFPALTTRMPKKEPLVPPFRYTIVEDRLYRGAYPMPINYPFLSRLRLKTIISLTPKKPDSNLLGYCEGEAIANVHIQVDKFKENVTLTHAHIARILPVVLRSDSYPLYIHCLDGANVTGLFILLLRQLQRWALPVAIAEFSRYTRDGVITPEEQEVVESFRMDLEISEGLLPRWLKLDKKVSPVKITQSEPERPPVATDKT